MSRLLYLDGFSGISGDMFLGACLDAGLPLDALREALGSLAVSGYAISAEPVLRAGVSATRFVVHEDAATAPPHEHEHTHTHTDADGTVHAHSHAHAHHPGHQHRSLPEIRTLIDGSALPSAGKDRAIAMFQRLAEAEARIHNMPVEQVHLHEVGELDSIIDIVGAVFAMAWVGADRVVCSPLNVGGGMVRSAHGLFPVPAPATLALLGGAPVYSGAVQKELVTPTGALIATTWADAFGPLPPMTIEAVGYGAGSRDNPDTPNVLRLIIGSSDDRPAAEPVVVIECEIDDMNPQLFGVAMERLYAAGALEVFYIPVQMKKSRPGTLLTVIATPELRRPLSDIIFRETTTIGVRYHEVERDILEREIIAVDTALGQVRFKLAWRAGRLVNATPEFEDCAALARAHNMSVKDVQALALQAYGARATAPPTAL
ncbi:MAG: nickel pincer cofactor biosynthesis protein LarC [Vicinamibacterales bacterium]